MIFLVWLIISPENIFMKIAIVDDEQDELEALSEIIKSHLSDLGISSIITDTFRSAEEFFSAWEAGKYELILLDIYMDGMTGIDAARRIRESDGDAFLVFCTSSNGFASESYEVRAHYYLCKPFSDKNISDMLKRLNLKSYEFSRFIDLPDGQRIVLRNIIYTEYYNHVVTIHNKNGGDIRTRISQSEFEALLGKYPYFCRCCKGIVVNFYEVTDYCKNSFTMSGNKTVSISRRKEKEVQTAYTDFCFERLRKEMRE